MNYCPECGARLISQTFCNECGINLSKYFEHTEKLAQKSNPNFGLYYKDNAADRSPIEWIVLEKKRNKALIISKFSIDCKPYSEIACDTTWETSSVRRWLNNEFLNLAFNSEEQKKIQTTQVITEENDEYGTEGCNVTEDKIFLLSIDEAIEYFSSDSARKCTPTAYACSEGAFEYCGYCPWLLRTPGCAHDLAAFVKVDGDIGYVGCNVNEVGFCVRPALWVELDREEYNEDDDDCNYENQATASGNPVARMFKAMSLLDENGRKIFTEFIHNSHGISDMDDIDAMVDFINAVKDTDNTTSENISDNESREYFEETSCSNCEYSDSELKYNVPHEENGSKE